MLHVLHLANKRKPWKKNDSEHSIEISQFIPQPARAPICQRIAKKSLAFSLQETLKTKSGDKKAAVIDGMKSLGNCERKNIF